MSGQYEGLSSLLAVLESWGGARPSGTASEDESFPAALRATLERTVSISTADKALGILRDEGLLDPADLAAIPARDLEAIFRTNRLAIRGTTLGPMIKLAGWFAVHCPEGDLSGYVTSDLRDEWRRINGLGRSTVDGILLALGRANYSIDRASFRIFARHGWVDPGMDEDEARGTFEALAPGDASRLAWLADQLGQVARDFCKASRACCEHCPLQPLLPSSGPIEE